jgi:hypothetical protein
MSAPFTLRFVLAEGWPSIDDIAPAWGERYTAERRADDGVLLIREGDRALARIDRLAAEDPRGRAVIAAVRHLATSRGEGEGLDAALFVLDDASGVIMAQPDVSDEDEIERALEPLDALWDLLFDAYGGVLQIDGEGIYGEEGLLVSLE